MSLPEDQELIAKITKGDTEALAGYLQSHRESILGFIRTITSTRLLSVVELDDLFQEVSTTALQSLHTAPLDQFTPLQWLQQIARRRVVDSHRHHFAAQRRDAGKQQSIHAPNDDSGDMGFEQLLAASMTSPSAALSQDLRLMRMQEAIKVLNEEQQTAIRLRYIDGLPTKEIAGRLNKTDVAIRVLLSRSIRQLESLLQDVKPSR